MPAKPAMIYDGDCAFCRKQIAGIQRRDVSREFEYVPRQTPGLDDRFSDTAAELILYCGGGFRPWKEAGLLIVWD